MEQHNQEIGTRRDLVLYRLETARNDLKSARALFSIENCASHSRYFSDELDAQFFYIKQNKCLIYYYGYGKILLWRKICLQLIKMVFPIRRQGKSCGENICEIRLIVL